MPIDRKLLKDLEKRRDVALRGGGADKQELDQESDKQHH